MVEFLASMRSSSRQVQFGVGALIIVLFLVYHSKLGFSDTEPPPPVVKTTQNSERLYGEDYHGRSTPDINRVTNATLGFSKVFVVGLPDRSDKRDAMVLTSAATGFHVEFVDGVKGETIPDKAVPFDIDRHKLMETNLGSWRGHMNAVRRIVSEDLESALIMEDDMDCCGEIFPEVLPENAGKPLHPKYTMFNDKTVPPFDKITGLVDWKQYPEFTRFVHVSGAPICTFAYALSQKGARKVLYDLSVDRLAGAFDNALAGLCRDGAAGNKNGLRAKCITVTPPVFFHHRAKGRIAGDSDIQTYENTEQVRQKGTTENIVWSARNNIKNMLMHGEMENQFGKY
ncbi:hypothetical protein KJ359_007728 [Pestalotiopsis sp. 9143b]|nr:hypothetical protein KJ359_007728 [Pestalotiopsis sp. 9143b]